MSEKVINQTFITSQFKYKLLFENGICTDILTKDLYDTSKSWYAQNGFYEDRNNSQIQLFPELKRKGNFFHPNSNANFRITFNSDFTGFTDAGGVAWNISSNAAAESVTVSSGSVVYELSFKGYSL